jgi:hypothetical protein
LRWGSLGWDKRNPRLSSRWHKDGPLLPVEYSRISSGGRLTLVIVPGIRKQRTLWAFSSYDKVGDAKENLRIREGHTRPEYIGVWEKSTKPNGDPVLTAISKWAERKGLTKVIWTALPPLDVTNQERRMSAKQALAYLRSLGNSQEGSQTVYCQDPRTNRHRGKDTRQGKVRVERRAPFQDVLRRLGGKI